MVRIVRKAEQLDYWQTMLVYEESNRIAAMKFGNRDRNEALIMAEQEFYAYLMDVFFETPGAFIAMWEDVGRIVSIVRVEPFEDGMLVAGLETAAEYRGRGCASALLRDVVAQLDCPIYSHVHKQNAGSLRVHDKCGFKIIDDSCILLNGVKSCEYYTLRLA